MRTNNYTSWVCRACNRPTLIDPEQPQYYCSVACKRRAAHAIEVLLSPQGKASRNLVSHLRDFYDGQIKKYGNDDLDRLNTMWASEVIEALGERIKLKPMYKSADRLVSFWYEIYYGGHA